MTEAVEATSVGGSMVTVWDPFVRVFHWALAIMIGLAWLTGDEQRTLHLSLGYCIAVLVALRIVWGLFGPGHARFSSFVRGPRATLTYLKALRQGKDRRYLGHNPAGAAMIIGLLITILGTALTGWLMLTDQFWGSSLMEELHEIAATVILLLVPLHVIGVIVESLRHRENLIYSMIDGKKHADGNSAD